MPFLHFILVRLFWAQCDCTFFSCSTTCLLTFFFVRLRTWCSSSVLHTCRFHVCPLHELAFNDIRFPHCMFALPLTHSAMRWVRPVPADSKMRAQTLSWIYSCERAEREFIKCTIHLIQNANFRKTPNQAKMYAEWNMCTHCTFCFLCKLHILEIVNNSKYTIVLFLFCWFLFFFFFLFC